MHFRSIMMAAAVLVGVTSPAFSQGVGDSPLLLNSDSSGNSRNQQASSRGSSSDPASQTTMNPAMIDQGKMNELAYQKALRELLPMTPDQIEAFKKRLDEAQRAQSKPINPSKPVTRSISLDLKPGENPPVVRLTQGHATSVTFSDVTGASWPIETVVPGNSEAFSVQPAGKEGETNIIVINPLTRYGSSNLIITLVGHPVPVALQLKAGEPEVDSRLDIKVEKRGPKADLDGTSSVSLPDTNDSVMMAFLDGVPPEEAVEHRTSSSEVEAWSYQEKLYVRTAHSLLSPAYQARSSNVSGTKVYVLADAPVLLVSANGRMASVAVRN